MQLTCRLCDVPVALVSLVAGDRQWFKARIGFPPCETDLNSSVCAYALARPNDLLIIPDLTADERTSANPLVIGEPFIRFYAGAPLVALDGQVLGSLCAIDKKPRPEGLTEAQQHDLRLLAQQVVSQLELRRTIAERDQVRADEDRAFRARDALRDTQAALATANGEMTETLRALVAGAMQAIPAAEGGVVETLHSGTLTYQGVAGTLEGYAGLQVPFAGSLAGHCAATRTPQLLTDVLTNPHVHQDIARRIGLRSGILVPVRQGDTVLGVLKLQSSQPAAFDARDLALLDLFAGATTAGLAAAEARIEMRAKDAYWRGLFDRLSEGFQINEALRDEAGQITDFRIIEINPAWSTLIGVPAGQMIDQMGRDLFGVAADEWIGNFARVVETGEPWFFTREFSPNGRWYEGRAFRLEGDRFGVIFQEVTQRVDADTRRAALMQLGDRLRDLTTIGEMTQAAAEIVGRTLGATRAGFGRVEGEVEYITIEPDWCAEGQVSIAGRHRFADYGDIRAHLARGEALVINDVTADPRTKNDPGPMQAIGIGSLVNMPVREQGRTVAVFIVHDVRPRAWQSEELAFLRNVADRVEVGVARVQAEELQTVLNRELSHRLKNTLAIVQSIAGQTLRKVTETEAVDAFTRRLLALSRAHDVLLNQSFQAAKMQAVMESVLTLQADLDRFAFDGPDLDISPEAALSLSLLLHELATNALKYGALSATAGKVRVTWRAEGGAAPTLVLDWTEEGGPMVTAPSNRAGFGSRLIRRGLLGTQQATLRYDPVGLRAEFRAPLAEVQVRVH